MTVTIALVATLAAGGSAAANWGSMELPNGCGDDWSGEGSID